MRSDLPCCHWLAGWQVKTAGRLAVQFTERASVVDK